MATGQAHCLDVNSVTSLCSALCGTLVPSKKQSVYIWTERITTNHNAWLLKLPRPAASPGPCDGIRSRWKLCAVILPAVQTASSTAGTGVSGCGNGSRSSTDPRCEQDRTVLCFGVVCLSFFHDILGDTERWPRYVAPGVVMEIVTYRSVKSGQFRQQLSQDEAVHRLSDVVAVFSGF